MATLRVRPGSLVMQRVLAMQYVMYYTVFMSDDRAVPSAYFTTGQRAQRPSASHLVSVRLPDELLRRLAEVGNQEGLAMSDTIRLVLERGLAVPDKPKRKV